MSSIERAMRRTFRADALWGCGRQGTEARHRNGTREQRGAMRRPDGVRRQAGAGNGEYPVSGRHHVFCRILPQFLQNRLLPCGQKNERARCCNAMHKAPWWSSPMF